mgnify:CR=1 FL=1
MSSGPPQLGRLEESGFSLSASASFAYNKMAEACPGDPCAKKEEPALKRTKERQHSKVSDDDDDWKGDDAEDLEKSEPMVETRVETRPKVRTVHRSGGEGRPRKVISELVGWENVVVPIAASTDEVLGLERERVIGSAGVSASGGHEQSNSMQSSFESSSESNQIISLGAAPAGDILEWAQQTMTENMPVYYSLSSVCQLVKLALERDFPGDLDRGEHTAPTKFPAYMNINVTSQLEQEVVNACNWAQYDDHYCMFLKSEGMFSTMTCDAPAGGVDRIPKTPECTSDAQCDGKRSKLHNKCYQGKCVMQYKRLVEVGVMTTKDENSNQCSNMEGMGWEEVAIDPTNSLGNSIKGGTSDSKIRLCAKYSEEPVNEKDASTYGVCKVMLSAWDGCFPTNGLNYVKPQMGGESDGDMNQWEHDPPLWLCIAKNGCEGRGNDDIANPVPALDGIGLSRNNDGNCSNDLAKGTRIATRGDADGDFNQGMSSGGDVFMCEQRATVI